MPDFRDPLVSLSDPDAATKQWKECQPKVLIVADLLNYDATNGFGLTQFIDTLASSEVHGMPPLIVKAARGAMPSADIENFHFDHAEHGVLISRYDVVFLFGFRSENDDQLPQAELDALARFMQAGGGVFATGDHDSMGAAISRDIPRVRSMRHWTEADTPDVADATRHSTNTGGADEQEDFSDQSDASPQRLYPNFRTEAGGLGMPHPLVQQVPPRRTLEVFPDHPHEGECVVPTDLATSFVLDGSTLDEWPVAEDMPTRISPEAVGYSMSHGTGFPVGPTGPKEALVPRSFIAICAYDGQRAGVGRVVTDATWHHFVNANLDGTGEPVLLGLREPAADPLNPPTDTEALIRIRQYYRNLATWLMPRTVRYCLSTRQVIADLARYPLFEEVDVPPPAEQSGEQMRDLGAAVAASLGRRLPPWQVTALMQDALDQALGAKAAARLATTAVGRATATDLRFAALGGFTSGIVATLEGVKQVARLRPHQAFDRVVAETAKHAVKLMLATKRAEVEKLHEVLRRVEL